MKLLNNCLVVEFRGLWGQQWPVYLSRTMAEKVGGSLQTVSSDLVPPGHPCYEV